MNFIELIKSGKKTRRPHFHPDEYFMACYYCAPDVERITKERVLGINLFENYKDFPMVKVGVMTIVKMKGEHIHPDWPKYQPSMRVADIMAEDWEVVE